MWLSIQVLAALLRSQLPAYVLGKQCRMAMFLGRYTHVGDSEVAPGSWLKTGPGPAVAAIWVTNQSGSSLFLSLRVSL